jgi:hypothetical protein
MSNTLPLNHLVPTEARWKTEGRKGQMADMEGSKKKMKDKFQFK